MTSTERLYGLYKAIQYVVDARIPGDMVECGIWRGGSSMAMALTLLSLGDVSRHLYMYDTYAGMTEPGVHDVDLHQTSAAKVWNRSRKAQGSEWCHASLDEVQRNLARTQYPPSNLHFVQGDVLETIPQVMPQAISVLRLDTDFYESTRHTMEHLYPLLSRSGVLIVDDYGHWQGAKKAVDEYFAAHDIHILLNRLDYTGRIGIKD